MLSKKDFTLTDIVLIILMLAYMLLTYYTKQHIQEYVTHDGIVLGLRTLKLLLGTTLAAILYYAYKDLFKQHWTIFKKRSWIKFLWIILAWIGIILILNTSRSLIKWFFDIQLLNHWSAVKTNETIFGLFPTLNIIIIGLNMLIIPFAKETVFRHIFFFKHQEAPYSWLIYGIIGGILYGLSYYFLNETIISCIPYMLSGIVCNIMYWHTKNIWYPIFAHTLFTFIIFLLSITNSFILPYCS